MPLFRHWISAPSKLENAGKYYFKLTLEFRILILRKGSARAAFEPAVVLRLLNQPYAFSTPQKHTPPIKRNTESESQKFCHFDFILSLGLFRAD